MACISDLYVTVRSGNFELLNFFAKAQMPAAARLVRNGLNDRAFKDSIIPRIRHNIEAAIAQQTAKGRPFLTSNSSCFDSPLARAQKRLRHVIL